jgi:squalene cyclase
LLGDSIDAPHMKKARDLVLKLGGAEQCNTYSKFYLAALGQMHYDSIPVIRRNSCCFRNGFIPSGQGVCVVPPQ